MVRQPEFGQRVRALRQQRQMSQRQLASDLVTPSYISLLESGGRVPTLDVVIHLANQLDVPVAELIDEEPLVTALDRNNLSSVLTEALAVSSTDDQDYAAAATTLRAAIAQARSQRSVARQLDLGVRLQHVLRALGDREERVALLEEMLALPGVSTNDELQVVLRTEYAAALREAGQLPQARAAAQEAQSRIEDTVLSGTAQHAKLMGVLVSVLVELQDVEPVEAHLTDLLRLADKVGGKATLGRVYWVAALAYARLGRREPALTHLRLAHQHLASPGMAMQEWLRFCRTTASVLLEIGDDLGEVRRWLDSAESTSRMLELPSEQKLVTALRAEYALATEDPAGARELADELLADSSDLPEKDQLRLRVLRERATVALGDTASAVANLRLVATDYERLGMLQAAVEVWRQIDGLRSGGRADGAGLNGSARSANSAMPDSG